VSVAGGGPYVGQRRLVRIDEVARSLASASLVDNGDGGESEADAEDQQLESSGSGRRRRGRRGGRGRSRASNE
jgi:ribonuclease G